MNATGKFDLLAKVYECGRTHAYVEAIYGFGSYFRGEPHRDVDLLCVVQCECDELLTNSAALRSNLYGVGVRQGEIIDLLIVNPVEFEKAPLQDMEELVAIYLRSEAENGGT